MGATSAAVSSAERASLQKWKVIPFSPVSLPVAQRVLWRAADAATARRADQVVAAEERLEGEFDLFHGHFAAGSRWLVRLAAGRRRPLVVTEHSTAFTGLNPDNRLTRGALRRAQSVYAEASSVTAVSQFLADIMRAAGVQATITVVPNPVSQATFRLDPNVPARATGHIAYVGRLATVKRPDLLLEALALLDESQVSLLHVVGDGPLAPSLRARAEQLGVAHRVRWHGWLQPSSVARILSQVEISVSASAVETFGVNAVESLMVGTPFCGFAVGPFPDMIEDENGLLVRKPTPSALADGIGLCLRRSRNCDRRLVSERAIGRWGDEAVSRSIRDVYAEFSEYRRS